MFIFLTSVFYVDHSFFSSVAHTVGTPFWRLAEDAEEKRSSFFSFFTSKSDLIAKKEDLKQRVIDLEKESKDVHALEFENKDLRRKLNMKPKGDVSMANVLARPPRVPYDALIIDGGRDMDYSVGDKVFGGESVILGEIKDVYRKTSLVVLYSSSGESNDVYLEDKEVLLEAKGRGGGKFILEIPRDKDVLKGDYLFKVDKKVSLLGEVVDVTVPDTGALKIIIARVPIDIFSIKSVFVASGTELDI